LALIQDVRIVSIVGLGISGVEFLGSLTRRLEAYMLVRWCM